MPGPPAPHRKPAFVEEATRVPWLKEEHGTGTNKLTELIDLYPTFIDLANRAAPETLQGTSLKPLLVNHDSSD